MTSTKHARQLTINRAEQRLIEQNVATVRQQIEQAAVEADRDPRDITIVAVSKTFSRATVDHAYEAGLRVFAENRVQELSETFGSDPLPGDAALHLVGQLQTNKVKQVLPLVDLIESVDRLKLVNALEKEATKLEREVAVLIQVNIAGEEQKSGCTPEEAPELLAAINAAPHLRCEGLMAIAPLVDNPEDARPVFRATRELRDRLQEAHPEASLRTLSMGMSNDFAVAITEGATHVRLGRAVFGSRPD